MKEHFLQSKNWATFQKSLGNEVFRIENKKFIASAILKKTTFGNYLFCPYGPAVEDLEGLKLAKESLLELANKSNSFFVRIEPTYEFTFEQMKDAGFVKSANINANATWVLDLDKDEKTLLGEIEKERTRIWRGKDRRGMNIRISKDPADIDILHNFIEDCAKKNGWVAETKEYLKKQLEQDFASLYIIELNKDGKVVPLSASLMFDDKNVRFYGHSANNEEKEYRKLRANGVLLVQAILDAKASGKKTFDFWGITTSDDPSHPWAGFTKFKKSFSGRAVKYSGTWDLPVNKTKYGAYLFLRKVNRALRSLRYH